VELMQALLAKGADPNINAMGFTPFLLAAGVNPGGGRGGGGGGPNLALLDVMIQHGADVNAQVTGTRTYSMRIEYHPPADKEGTSALHEAAQAGRAEMVKYLLDKGANPSIVDANGKKPIDLVGAAPLAAAAAGGRGGSAGNAAVGRGGAGTVNPQTLAEIRALLEDAAAKK
jgi:hypothetical protein